MKDVSIITQVYVLLDPPLGVSLYIGEGDSPADTVTIADLVSEWVEHASVERGIDIFHVADALALIAQLQEAIDLVTEALPQ